MVYEVTRNGALYFILNEKVKPANCHPMMMTNMCKAQRTWHNSIMKIEAPSNWFRCFFHFIVEYSVAQKKKRSTRQCRRNIVAYTDSLLWFSFLFSYQEMWLLRVVAHRTLNTFDLSPENFLSHSFHCLRFLEFSPRQIFVTQHFKFMLSIMPSKNGNQWGAEH